MKFVIEADGKVKEARITESSLGDPAVGECMLARMRTWLFPVVKGGGEVVVTYPFTFAPAQ